MARDSDGVDLVRYRQDIVGMFVKELFSVAVEERKKYGSQFSDELLMSVLASIVSTCVLNSLKTADISADLTKQTEQTFDNYAMVKSFLQDAVAKGFEGGFTAFNPDVVPDFVCEIFPIDSGIAPKIPS